MSARHEREAAAFEARGVRNGEQGAPCPPAPRAADCDEPDECTCPDGVERCDRGTGRAEMREDRPMGKPRPFYGGQEVILSGPRLEGLHIVTDDRLPPGEAVLVQGRPLVLWASGDITHELAVSRETLRRWRAFPDFPAPRWQVSRGTLELWDAAEVRAWHQQARDEGRVR